MVKEWRPVRERSRVSRTEVREATGEQLLLWQSPKHGNVGPGFDVADLHLTLPLGQP